MTSYRDVWSIGLGRWRGVPLRLHIFFVLFAVFTAFLAWQERHQDPALIGLALVSIVLLLFSVLIHELGHLFAATRLGGHLDAMVLTPVGGLRPARVPDDPQSELLAVLAGPCATLLLCLACLCGATWESSGPALQLLHPLAPGSLFLQPAETSHFGTLVRLGCWINWWLLVVNLIPAFPFDGGRACVAFLQVVRPTLDTDRAVGMVALMARVVAVLLFALAFIFRDAFPGSTVPSWMALLLLSVFVFFSARMEEYHAESSEPDGEVFGYDFSQGYTSLEKSQRPREKPVGPLTRWWNRRKESQRLRRAAVEAAEDRQADQILERLHLHGMNSLTPRERALLRRVSVRYRTRQR